MIGAAQLAAIAAVAILMLTGCAPHPSASASPGAAGKPSASATPKSSPTPSLPALPADVLFQITTTATAPGGATARLTETVHAPLASTDNQTADEAQLDDECDSWRSAFPNIRYVVAEVSTTVTSGTWDPNDIVAADMAAYPVWSGDQQPFQAFCASALPKIPGAARAVSPVGGNSPDSSGGWAIYRYGFGVPTDPAAGETASPQDVTLSDCSIQLGSAASTSIFASTWKASPQTDNGLSCFYGGTS
jgi:hypothetical protein